MPSAAAADRAAVKTVFQQEPSSTGYEYAAGEVTLPFSYSASISTAPRPPCLDFSPSGYPDGSHVFVHMDGELWMFRTDWVDELADRRVTRGRTWII